MDRKLIEDVLFDAMKESSTESRSGAISGSLLLNAYSEKFEFDLNKIKDSIDHHYNTKLAFLSFITVINDKKVRKKLFKIANNFLKDGYSSVKKSAAFVQPFEWISEKPKNQTKKVSKLGDKILNYENSLMEGFLLGLGCASPELVPETATEIFNIYNRVASEKWNETNLIATCFGLGLAAATFKRFDFYEIIEKINNAQTKRIRTSLSQMLSLLIPFMDKGEVIKTIQLMIKIPAYQETWPMNLAVINALLIQKSSQEKLELIDEFEKLIPNLDENHEMELILETFKNSNDSTQILYKLASGDYSQLRMASIVATYTAESSKHQLSDKGVKIKEFVKIPLLLVKDPSASVRTLALYRLLSFSLSLKTLDFITDFKDHIHDQLSKNRMISALAIQYIIGLADPSKAKTTMDDLFGTNDPHVQRGSLIGLGMGGNHLIHDSDTADEHILGLFELNGESYYLGYILSVIGLY